MRRRKFLNDFTATLGAVALTACAGGGGGGEGSSSAKSTSSSTGPSADLAAAVGLAKAGISLPAQGGSIAPSVLANRTSGVAPLAVQFDATATTAGSLTANPFAELYYVTHFGDDNSATWSYGNKAGVSKKNLAFGPVVAHVFETAGAYTVKTTAFYVSATGVLSVGATATVTIIVTDPNTVYSGANTVCIANGTLPVAGTNGVPTGAVCVNTSNVGTISAYCTAGKRVLLKRGDVWNTTSAVNLSGAGGTLGAYGSGALPKLALQPGTGSYSSAVQMLTGSSDWRCMDIEVDGSAVPQAVDHSQTTGLRGIQPESFCTALRIYTHHIGNGTTAGNANDISFVDCRFETGTGGYGNVLLYAAACERVAVLGCNLYDAYNIEHCCRLQGARYVVFSNNTAAYPGWYQSTQRHCFALRGYSNAADGTWLGIYSEKAVVSDNYFTGEGGLLCQFESQGAEKDERIRDVIFERNTAVPLTSGTAVDTAAVSNMTIRNNLFFTVNSDAVDVRQNTTSGTPAPTSTYVYHNTAYCSGNSNYSFFGNISYNGGTAPSGTQVFNNLVYAPNATKNLGNGGTAGTLGFYLSGVTLGSNSTDAQIKNTAPGFSTPSTTDISSWRPVGGYGNNAGSWVPVFDDVNQTPRVGAYDLGALSV